MAKVIVFFCLILSAGAAFGQTQAPEVINPATSAKLALLQFGENIKSINEPELRIILSDWYATFLWHRLPSDRQAQSIAERITLEALADLANHEKEIGLFTAKRYRRNLLALLQRYAPKLAAQYERQDQATEQAARKPPQNPYEIAFALMDTPGGMQQAIDLVRRALMNGQPPDITLDYILTRLEAEHPDRVIPYLDELLSLEEQRQGTIPLRNWLGLFRHFLKYEGNLLRRYQLVVLKALEANQQALDQEAASMAYAHLTNYYMPRLQHTAPEMYARALRLAAVFKNRLTPYEQEQTALWGRINQSDDPVRAILAETEGMQDENRRYLLLSRAAEILLSRGQFQEALDVLPHMALEEMYQGWQDQFFGEVAAAALKKDDPDMALRATERIVDPLRRAYEMQPIVLYLHKNGDLFRAREVLNESAKLVEKAENGEEKAREVLGLASTSGVVDEVRAPEFLRTAIALINRIPAPGLEHKPGSKGRREYHSQLEGICWNLVPVFSRLVRQDEIGIRALADNIQHRGLRLAAIFGSLAGTYLAAGEANQKPAKN